MSLQRTNGRSVRKTEEAVIGWPCRKKMCIRDSTYSASLSFTLSPSPSLSSICISSPLSFNQNTYICVSVLCILCVFVDRCVQNLELHSSYSNKYAKLTEFRYSVSKPKFQLFHDYLDRLFISASITVKKVQCARR